MRKLFIRCLMAFLFAPIFCQNAEIVSEILSKDRATCMDFSYLVASELGMDCTPFEAYAYCDSFGSFAFTSDAATPIKVKTVSHFFVNNYGLKGGLMWGAFHNPRYAWKELKAAGFWKAGTDPDSILSGRDLVRAVSNFFLAYPEASLRNPPERKASDQFLKALLSEEENEI